MKNSNIEEKVADLRNKLTPLYNLAAIMNQAVKYTDSESWIKPNEVVRNCAIDSYNSLPIVREIIDSMLEEPSVDEHEMLMEYRKLSIKLLESFDFFINGRKDFEAVKSSIYVLNKYKEIRDTLDEKLINRS